ncbi:MAG: PqqD family protein [Clostridia bacterium]|nr:PqqD family protein [Clostridia bacterium]
MKLKYQFIINEVADQMVAVAVGDDMEKFNGFVKMNDIGVQIFELLKNEITLDEIIAEMLKKHPESTEQEARETITEFTDKLKAEGVVE